MEATAQAAAAPREQLTFGLSAFTLAARLCQTHRTQLRVQRQAPPSAVNNGHVYFSR